MRCSFSAGNTFIFVPAESPLLAGLGGKVVTAAAFCVICAIFRMILEDMKAKIILLLSILPGTAFPQMKSDLELENIKGKVKCMIEKVCYNPTKENCFYHKIVSYYDQRGFLLSRDTYDDNVLSNRDSVLYDASGNKKEAYCHSYALGGIEKKTFEIDNARNQIIERYFNEDGSSGRSMVISFNDKGDIVEYKIIEYDGNLRGTIVYKYDSKGNRVDELTPPYTHLRYKYDEFGNRIERTSNTDEFLFRTTYEYGPLDKNGNWQTMTEASNSEPVPTKFTREFTYW
jgi:YD repeat-containing protein